MEIKNIEIDHIDSNMIIEFNHIQSIKHKYIKTEGEWKVIDTDEVRQWNLDKRLWIPKYLSQQIKRGGFAIGAYDNGRLVGFGCADGCLCGRKAKYMNLTMLFTDDRFQRKGIGKKLFSEICNLAAQKGGERLFISAVPSVETVSFYQNLGCRDAREIIDEYIDTENDRYLEYVLQ